jgi:hypothetical protein
MRKIRLWITYLLLPAIAILLSVCTLSFVHSKAKQVSYMSAVSWLRTTVLEELNKYYARSGTYPLRIQDLSIAFPGDNANPEMLTLFTYTSDKDSFRLILETGSAEGYRYEYIGAKGSVVRCNEYLGNKLIRSMDANEFGSYDIRFGE